VGSEYGHGFACINGKNNLPADVTPGSQDGRAWNLWPRRDSGSYVTYSRTGLGFSIVMKSAFYRLHMTAQQAAGDRQTGITIPAKTISGTAFPARQVAQGCQFADGSRQIGCLIEASPCSIGFAGLSAGTPNAACGSAANRRALALQVPAGGAVTATPSKANIRRFLDPFGPGCTAAGDYDIRYPLTLGLWLCTADGVPNAAGVGVTTGTQSVAFLQAQNKLAGCFQNRTIVDRAANAVEFITLDDTGATPISFRTSQ
jgi:hypothetical protein